MAWLRKDGTTVIRPTKFEQVRRIETILNWFARGLSLVQVKIQARKEWGVSAFTAHRYVLRAREWQLRAVRSPVDFYRAGAMRFYDQVIMDPKASNRDKIEANKAKIAVLTMMDNRIQLNHTGHVGVGLDIGDGVRDLIEAMSSNSRIRGEVINLDRDLEALASAARGDKNGSAVLVTGTNGFHDPGNNGKNGAGGKHNGVNGTIPDAETHHGDGSGTA